MFLKNRKGQSALEYLMTYGWALVVIVIVVAALVFLINPSQIGGQSCTGFQNMPVGNFQFNSDGLNMVLTNQTGRSLSQVQFGARFQNGGTTYHVNTVPTSMAANAQATADLTNVPTFNFTGIVTADLNVIYWDGDFNRTATATCKGTV